MSGREVLSLNINGRDREIFTEGEATLLDVLRGDLALRAAKRGCNQGVCGACTVMVDDLPVRGCLTLAGACTGRKVTTLEGLADDPAMQALQEAMIASGGVQCGFCTAGMLITARDLIAWTPGVDAAQIRAALSGNLCRCTGYVRIIEAVMDAAMRLTGQKETAQ